MPSFLNKRLDGIESPGTRIYFLGKISILFKEFPINLIVLEILEEDLIRNTFSSNLTGLGDENAEIVDNVHLISMKTRVSNLVSNPSL